ncbi:MAG: hypothetical protein U9N39_10195 [Campylobacterota bacterium]|nr:hypothetical protein [Campylobacterota bacterium]
MNTYIDIIMVILFVFFMIFIFGGYHKTKSLQREKEEKLQEENTNSLK